MEMLMNLAAVAVLMGYLAVVGYACIKKMYSIGIWEEEEDNGGKDNVKTGV